MRVDPVTDVLAFLTKPVYGEPQWLHEVYWLLAIVSLSIALAAWRALPGQARPVHLLRSAVRFLVASFWWGQSLWAFPTDTEALRAWTKLEADQAAYAIQATLVKSVILPHFTPFAVCLYLFEVVIAVALFLGLYTRIVSTLGALLMFSLFLNVYRAPMEWPWSYVFPFVLMAIIAIEDYGLSLGLDAYLEARSPAARLRRAAASAI